MQTQLGGHADFYVLLFAFVYMAWCDFVVDPTKEQHLFSCKSLNSATQTLALIRQAFGEDCLSRTRKGQTHRDRKSQRPRGTFYPHKLAITSPTSGGRSVGIIRSRTQTMEFVCDNGVSWPTWRYYCSTFPEELRKSLKYRNEDI
jgi:hypothetical protein